jgi:large subunit ribosomal protein L24
MGQMRKRHDAGTYKPHVKKGDEVLVLAGRSLGERGRIITVDPQRERAVVEGANMVTKHQKQQGGPGGGRQQGGRVDTAAPIHVSNLMVVCPNCSKPTRVAHKQVEGRWNRACKNCNESLERPR